MYQHKSLIVVLSMHRSGSSLTANVLQRLGMSLGPFELLGATPYNAYGHFEAVPIYELDRRLQQLVFGFAEDLPESREAFERFRECEGRWSPDVRIPSAFYHEGRRLIEQLLASGRVSGFKDPRVPLLWPFWSRVLAEFPGLHVVPLFVLRSPHEVAMSIFRRSQGVFSYHDVLEATAVHLTRMWSVWESWAARRALVRFDPRYYEEDMSRTAAICGLPWSAQVFCETYDADCKHHEPVVVSHRSQTIFERFAGVRSDCLSRENLVQAERDAAVRERILRNYLQRYRETLADFHADVDYFRRLLTQHDTEVAQLRTFLAEARCRAETAEGELQRIRNTRTWRIRNWVLQCLGVPVESNGEQAKGRAGMTDADGQAVRASGKQADSNAGQAAGGSREPDSDTREAHANAANADSNARQADGAGRDDGQRCPGAAV